jgi:hypothetical protein
MIIREEGGVGFPYKTPTTPKPTSRPAIPVASRGRGVVWSAFDTRGTVQAS